MNAKQFNILTLFLLLLIIAGNSACGTTRINAQNPNNRTETTRTEISDSTTPAYKPPKRISKDVIKTEEKPETNVKRKQKKK